MTVSAFAVQAPYVQHSEGHAPLSMYLAGGESALVAMPGDRATTTATISVLIRPPSFRLMSRFGGGPGNARCRVLHKRAAVHGTLRINSSICFETSRAFQYVNRYLTTYLAPTNGNR